MADDKRNRGDQEQGGKQPGTDRQRRDRKSGGSGGGMEPPDRGRTGRQDEQEPQE